MRNKTRYALFALFLMAFIVNAFAYDLNSCKSVGDWNGIGNCIARGAFGGDFLFFSMIMLLLMAIFMWQARMPAGAAIGVSLIMFFGLLPFMVNIALPLINLIIVVIGISVGLAILHFVRR